MVNIRVVDPQTGFERTFTHDNVSGDEIAQVVEDYLDSFCREIESVAADEKA